MITLSEKQKFNGGAVIVPLQSRISNLLSSRIATISHLSGYPAAIHAIGRLQREIKLDSYDALLKSLLKMRDLTRIAAEVIDAMEGVKTDRYQLNRTDIIAYVHTVTANYGSITITTDDEDLIAHLITSFEANQGAWVLQGGSSSDNLHLTMKALYTSVLGSVASNDLPIYVVNDTIQTVSSLAQFKLSTNKKDVESNAQKIQALANAKPIFALAATRLIDHVYELLMNRDIWYSFVSPRAKAEVASNMERSKSLKVFSLYLQSLLSYHQFFMLETFMLGYQYVQEWITYFPPLEEQTVFKLNNLIRVHDNLGAKQDVATIFSSFVKKAERSDLSPTVVFPAELLQSFGIKTAVENLNTIINTLKFTGTIADLSSLEDKKYLPLVSGIAATTFDVTQDLTTVLLLGKAVSHEIDLAVAGLVPSLVRGANKATIDQLATLELSCNLPFILPGSLSYDVESGVDKNISSGHLVLDNNAPRFSWDFHKYIRENFRYKISSKSALAAAYPSFSEMQISDRDKASDLRVMMDRQWKSLMPSTSSSGQNIYTKEILASHPHAVRNLIETLTGKSFDISLRELDVPHLVKLWATFLSSFALIYKNEIPATISTPLSDVAFASLTLVSGYGKPWGTTYPDLASKQTAISDVSKDLIKVDDTTYLRILNSIPSATPDLYYDKNFYQQHPLFYFGSNSVVENVSEWVIEEGLLHIAQFPVTPVSHVPSCIFTSKYAYMTDTLIMNMDLYFKPSVPSQAATSYPLAVVESEWPFERIDYYVKYKHFGTYSKPGFDAEISEESEMVKKAVKSIEDTLDNEQKIISKDDVKIDESVKTMKVKSSDEIKKATEVAFEDNKDDQKPFIIKK